MTLQRGNARQAWLHMLAAGLTLIAFMGLLGLELWSSRRNELARAEAEIATQTQLLASHVADRIGRIDVVLQGVAREYPKWAGRSAAQIDADLAVFLKLIPDSQSLRIGAPDGHIVYDASGKPPATSIYDRAYVRRLREDARAGLVLSEPIFARFTANWVITLSRRLEPLAPRFLGHVQAAINAGQFAGLFAQLVHERGDVVALYDDAVRLVARSPAAPAQLGQRVEGARFETLIRQGQMAGSYVKAAAIDGVVRHYAYARVSGLPLVVVVGRTEADILRDWTVKAWAYGGASALLAAVLALFLAALKRSYGQALHYGDEMADAAQLAQRQALTLLNAIPDPAWLRDLSGRFLAANQAYLDLCGKAQADVVGHPLEDVWPLAEARRFRANDERLMREGVALSETREQQHPLLGPRTYDYVRLPVHDVQGRVSALMGFARDLTPRRQAEDRAAYLIAHDALTDLPNRSGLDAQVLALLGAASQRQAQVAVMLVDIDHFMRINDALGHDLGDALLRELAQRLRRCVGAGDWLARLGGDEFVLLKAGWPEPLALADWAQGVLEAVRQPFELGAQTPHVTVSMGCALFPEHGRDVHHLLRHADAALRHAKQLGRDTWALFASHLDTHQAERLAQEARLREAVLGGRLGVHYQPQVSLRDGQVVGLEALVRWTDPASGPVSPAQFVPMAEQIGLIKKLGEWVLRQACLQAARWAQEHPGRAHRVVAVNLSALQLADPVLLPQVRAALAESGLPAACLELELTESVLLADVDRTIAVLDELHQMGVRLAIDDFGTGYSSFAYLRRLPVDKIKIDQSFVRAMAGDGRSAAVVEGMVALATKLGLEVIAEGAETEVELRLLTRVGCAQVQGFALCRPLAAAQVQAHLDQAFPLPEMG